MYQLALYVLAPCALFGLLLHVLWGLLFAATVFPWLSQTARNRVIKFWSRILLIIVGLRLEPKGEPVDPEVAATGIATWSSGRVLLANHVSWVDVYAMNATVPTRFIAKAEIARWPLIGTLVSLVGTLYVERGRRHAVHAINKTVAERLRHGETIGIFPEGTTTDGSMLLPFHANLVQPALEVGGEIRPVALRYTQDGRPSVAAAYVGDDNLVMSLWRIVTAPRLAVEVHWLPALPKEVDSRHAAGKAAQAAIAGAIGLARTVNEASAPADSAPEADADRATATR